MGHETKQKWPTYEELYYSKDGSIYKKVGAPYDAHYLIENQYDDNNEWWNIHPARFPDQYQGGIYGKDSPAKELFK
ncbi:hypothetical protein AV926_10290 [Myroides marinus]|uniref:Uncharacterized protein n=1 Tax=Myroides marinus TaxID=703342 RepID=A0A161SGC7_9FLAO|nr:hypothetical protein [Myroides marinus]KZE80245.1 hypothetical protein AV926_10290 [Myroides marinus]